MKRRPVLKPKDRAAVINWAQSLFDKDIERWSQKHERVPVEEKK